MDFSNELSLARTFEEAQKVTEETLKFNFGIKGIFYGISFDPQHTYETEERRNLIADANKKTKCSGSAISRIKFSSTYYDEWNFAIETNPELFECVSFDCLINKKRDVLWQDLHHFLTDKTAKRERKLNDYMGGSLMDNGITLQCNFHEAQPYPSVFGLNAGLHDKTGFAKLWAEQHEIIRRIVNEFDAAVRQNHLENWCGLSKSELEILKLGRSYDINEIALLRHRSENTIKQQISSIKSKLKANNLQSAYLHALTVGLIKNELY